MESLIEYRYSCELAIFNYLKNGDSDALIRALRDVELQAEYSIGSENSELWFKFGDDCTLVTTIRDIENDINLPKTHINKKLILDSFKQIIGLNPKNELRVFYS